MKKRFRGYYKLSNKEIQNIWDNGFVSLDTNVLLNIYRYSEETRKELIKVIKNYSEQLWLTNHTAFEFHKNRITVVTDQISIYEKTIKTFTDLENEIIKNIKTPHLSDIIRTQFEKTIKDIIKDLEKKKHSYLKLLSDDKILNQITAIFNNKVADGFNADEISKIEKEGEIRYKKKVPPGYKDNEKNENKYGDLIIWKELINKAKNENRSFILIIDDIKEDWWLRFQGKTISPRQELLQELYNETGQIFHLYTLDRFLEFASKTKVIKQKAIHEIREVQTEKQPIYYYDNFKISPSRNDNYINRRDLIYEFDKLENLSDIQKTWKTISEISRYDFQNPLRENVDQFSNIQKTLKALSEINNMNSFHDNIKKIIGNDNSDRPIIDDKENQ